MHTKILSYVLAAAIGAGSVAGYHRFHHPLKHTQACFLAQSDGRSFWFIRPNREIFEMYLDNPPEIFNRVRDFRDITYTDDNADMRHFVSAQLK